jgi:hypothetical protein
MSEDDLLYVDPLNDEHRVDIGIAMGLAAAINTLQGGSATFEKLPGFNTAIALLQAVEAQHRAQIAGMNFRAAAKAGHDLSTTMVGLIGRGRIYVKPMDLKELAHFGLDRQ